MFAISAAPDNKWPVLHNVIIVLYLESSMFKRISTKKNRYILPVNFIYFIADVFGIHLSGSGGEWNKAFERKTYPPTQRFDCFIV